MASYISEDIENLFYSCRIGDINRIEYLIEYKDIELNVRDAWDSTPLYYACLCGHEELVRFLLANGARCDANTFDGERCLYAALYDEIRDLLKEHRAITSHIMKRDAYHEFLRKCLERGAHTDFVFKVHDKSISAHRCILVARCKYFCNKLCREWNRTKCAVIKRSDLLKPGAFEQLLKYLYLGYIDVPLEQVQSLSRLAKQCHLRELQEQLEKQSRLANEYFTSKPSMRITIITINGCRSLDAVQNDMKMLVIRLLPEKFRSVVKIAQSLVGHHLCDYDNGQFNNEIPKLLLFPDVVFLIQGVAFQGHKVCFCERSDYFKALLFGDFVESIANTDPDEIPAVSLNDVTPKVFAIVMAFIYTGDVEMSSDILYDILYAADMFLLPSLKKLCSRVLVKDLQVDNVILTLKHARLFSMSRLEMNCAKFIADHLLEMVEREDFANTILEDAAEILQRQETDTISIVDEIRYNLEQDEHSLPLMYQEHKLKSDALDELLMKLNMEC